MEFMEQCDDIDKTTILSVWVYRVNTATHQHVCLCLACTFFHSSIDDIAGLIERKKVILVVDSFIYLLSHLVILSVLSNFDVQIISRHQLFEQRVSFFISYIAQVAT